MPPELKALISGKRVAVVGNAQSLNSTTYGKEIDSHDVVIRINHAANFFIGDERFDNEDCDLEAAVGSKIDVWAIWDKRNYVFWVNRLPKKAQEMYNKDAGVQVPLLDLAMGRRWQGFFWIPRGRNWDEDDSKVPKDNKEYGEKYKDQIQFKGELCRDFRNPSSGLTVLRLIDMCQRRGTTVKAPKGRMSLGRSMEVNIYGFDFKATPTFNKPDEKITETEAGERMCRFGHTFIREQKEVLRLCKENGWKLKQ
jgi:hypothetical protein